MRTLLGYGILALGIVFATARLQTPAPLPADADPVAFSASRAFVDIRAVARKPHPVTTAEHDRVRDYIVERLKQIGLDSSLRPGSGISAMPGRLFTAPVVNVAGVLAGKDRTKPAVLVMTHYDSVPNSPGAADDSAGVAATLEIARALKAGPRPLRDVIFLFTDGEELGLIGASAFFDSDPLASHVGAVINFEARGDSGLAHMFETGANNRETVAAYAAAARRPSANSLARLIYRYMPNGTDFTVPLHRGLPGLNFAFLGDEAAYHTPLATPEHLSLGSVQHMGDQALASARAFITAIPSQSGDSVYCDVFGLFVIQYSFLVGWLILGVAAALTLYAVWRSNRDTARDWLRGSAGAVLLVVAPGLLLWAAGRALSEFDHFQKLSHFEFLLAGACLIALGTAAVVIHAVEQGRGRLAVVIAALLAAIVCVLPGVDYVGLGLAAATLLLAAIAIRLGRHPAALWPATLLLLLVLSIAAQGVAPEGAFVFVWPLLLAGAVAAMRASLPRGAWQGVIAAMIAAFLVVTFAASQGAMFFTAVGVDVPAVLVLPLLMLLPLMLLVPGTERLPLAAHGALVLAGIALFAFGGWAPATAARPQPSMVRFVQDSDTDKAYRVASFAPLDPWEKTSLGEAPRHEALPWSNGRKVWWAPAKPVQLPVAAIVIRREGTRVIVSVNPPPGAYSSVLQIRPASAITKVAFNGAPTKTVFRQNSWNEISAYAPEPYRVSLESPAHGKLEIRLFTTWLDWPSAVPPLPPMPKQQMAFSTSGGTQTVLQRSFAW